MDVGSSRAIGLLLGPSFGVVVESLPRHGRSAPSFDIAVEPHMEDVRMSFEDKHCSASENDCSSVLRQTPQNGLGLGNVGHDAKGFGALCNSDEEAACLQDAVEHSANHVAVLAVAVVSEARGEPGYTWGAGLRPQDEAYREGRSRRDRWFLGCRAAQAEGLEAPVLGGVELRIQVPRSPGAGEA